VIFIVDEVIEPARRDYAEERLVHGPAGPRDRRLERRDFLGERRGPLRLDRALGDGALSLRRRRPLAGHVEDRAGLVGVLVELRELIALAGVGPRRAGFAGPERPPLESGEMAAVIDEVAGLPEFAVADAVDAD